ncbi:asparagine synthase (glutamine-hydrolyzing) [Occallatibacter riparius]|uniref:asparagine synthase (glutamine-hydrolyzing) n=1 Tax=Occallatibacter riparius TaxID=1002689 RepID=A0A9J7BL75_9BACT|nr:asparagine synthase (glutamine-hydrolyzing) [Occallatibacter riparius]UWZ83636.1 asparagine synthase (glutamine-hydrolyzing) [Occallatibacter riparius]
MCGIVGVYSRREPVSPAALERATNSLYHRGPDGQRHWISPDRRVGLGHTRLSIIDLATGDQPLSSEDNRTHVVVNGEFYGYESIRHDLQQRGHHLATKADSEIALHLYEELGPHCLEHLRGESALVLWDENRRRLFAARDRFGIKPLFYAWHNDKLYLASEVKALFAAGVPARWDEESVFHSVAFGGHQMRTLYDGVFQVPPGYYMLVTDKHVQLNQYWDFNYPRRDQALAARSDADYIAEFRHAIDEAVRIRLRADVPVGVYLSGGLDSCSVLGLAARHHPDPIKAFTLTFEDAAYDEGPIAREMAALAGAEFHAIPINQRNLADNFADAIAQTETVCINAHGVAKYLLSKAVRDAGYKVVITGEGSDEILGGYPHFRRDMLLYNREGQSEAAINELLRWLDEHNTVSRGLLLPDGEIGDLSAVKRVLGYVPSWIETFSSRAVKVRPLFAPDFHQRYGHREGEYNILDDTNVLTQLRGRDPIHQSLYLWSKTVMAGYILTMLGDRMEMAHSIEGRVPFLDHKLVDVIVSQPVHMKIRGMTEKFVLREAVRDVITDTVYRRQKHPFLSPPATVHPDGTFQTFVQDTLRGETLRSMPFFDQKAIVSLLDRLPSMDVGARTANDQILMHIVSMCVLQDRLGVATSPAAEAQAEIPLEVGVPAD